MYTYERLRQLCKYDNNESDIAYYLLNHLDSLENLTMSKIVRDTGISKASIHRFYSKGGYLNFKDLVLTLNDEIKEKQLVNFDYNQYKKKMISYIEMNDFDESQIQYLIDSIKKAKHIIFYGNTSEIMCLQELQFYLFLNHIQVIFLDKWDLKSCYQLLDSFLSEDVFIMVESSWHIQLIYENSIVNSHILSLDVVNQMPFQKFYIGQADCLQYHTFKNIKIAHNDDTQYLSIMMLDQKIKKMLL